MAESTDGVYTVEKLTSRRVKNKRVQYLVRWQGYGPKDDSWEDERNILDQNLIEEYEHEYGVGQSRGGKSDTAAAKPTKPKNNDTAIALEVAAICEAIKTFGPGDAFVKELQAAAASRLAAAA